LYAHTIKLNKGDIMGRAIQMSSDIELLKLKVEKLENQLRGMVAKIESLDSNKPKTKKEVVNEEKETNNEGDGKSNKQSDNKPRKSSKKTV
tara:strand:+ start:748 stop:1020 length:273 start_codon:yes stop_codon:yes gene_type:complete